MGDNNIQQFNHDVFISYFALGEESFRDSFGTEYAKSSYNAPRSRARRMTCGLVCEDRFCIGPEGELYKREHDFGKTNRIVGNIFGGRNEKLLNEFRQARAYFYCNLKEPPLALFYASESFFSIEGNCCVSVDSVTDCNYNNYIESLKNVLKKVQFASCLLLTLFRPNYQNILKNACRNKPARRLNKPVPEGQGRNGICPTKGIDMYYEQL